MFSSPSISTRARLSQRLSLDQRRMQKCCSFPVRENTLPRMEIVAHQIVLRAHPNQHQTVYAFALKLCMQENLSKTNKKQKQARFRPLGPYSRARADAPPLLIDDKIIRHRPSI